MRNLAAVSSGVDMGRKGWLSVLFNLLFPGLGHVYIGLFRRGIAMVGLQLIVSFLLAGVMMFDTFRNGSALMGVFAPGSQVVRWLPLFLNVLIAIDGYLLCRKGVTDAVPVRGRYWKYFGVYLLFTIVIGGGMALSIRANVVEPYKVPTNAMAPTIKPGDRVMVDKRIYRRTDPRRGDIAAFRAAVAGESEKIYIKRVVGLPGETVELKLGSVYINGVPVTGGYIKSNFYYNVGEYGKEGRAFRVPDGYYYVLGDNSASSRDSRYFGPVPRKDFIGQCIQIWWPRERARRFDGDL